MNRGRGNRLSELKGSCKICSISLYEYTAVKRTSQKVCHFKSCLECKFFCPSPCSPSCLLCITKQIMPRPHEGCDGPRPSHLKTPCLTLPFTSSPRRPSQRKQAILVTRAHREKLSAPSGKPLLLRLRKKRS